MLTSRPVCLAIALAAAVSGVLAFHDHAPAFAQTQAAASLPNPYDVTIRWWSVPDGPEWVAGAGIGLDRQRHVWAVCQTAGCADSPEGPVLDFDQSGKLVRRFGAGDRKSTRLNSSHIQKSRMPSSA